MIQLTTLLLALSSTALAAKVAPSSEFLAYLTKHGKSYADAAEFQMRQQLFLESDAFIKMRNGQKKGWTVGHNEFSDWTLAERKAMLNYKPFS